MYVLSLTVSIATLHMLLSKCDVNCINDSNTGLAASREAGRETSSVGWDQEIDGLWQWTWSWRQEGTNTGGWSIKVQWEAPYLHKEHSWAQQDSTVGNDKVTHVALGHSPLEKLKKKWADIRSQCSLREVSVITVVMPKFTVRRQGLTMSC